MKTKKTSRTADGRRNECIRAVRLRRLCCQDRRLGADAADTSASAESDVDYVKSNGKLVIGITDFAPMDYKEDGSDEWVGFDADMAKAFAESLGVKLSSSRSTGTTRSWSWIPRALTLFGTA